jgi:hypothetical protein
VSRHSSSVHCECGHVATVVNRSRHADCCDTRLLFHRRLKETHSCRKRVMTRSAPASLHMMVELIDDFFAEYPAPAAGSNKVDTGEADEVIGAIARTAAELTSRQDGTIRQQLIEQLMREIMKYDVEFRSEEAIGSSGSRARH